MVLSAVECERIKDLGDILVYTSNCQTRKIACTALQEMGDEAVQHVIAMLDDDANRHTDIRVHKALDTLGSTRATMAHNSSRLQIGLEQHITSESATGSACLQVGLEQHITNESATGSACLQVGLEQHLTSGSGTDSPRLPIGQHVAIDIAPDSSRLQMGLEQHNTDENVTGSPHLPIGLEQHAIIASATDSPCLQIGLQHHVVSDGATDFPFSQIGLDQHVANDGATDSLLEVSLEPPVASESATDLALEDLSPRVRSFDKDQNSESATVANVSLQPPRPGVLIPPDADGGAHNVGDLKQLPLPAVKPLSVEQLAPQSDDAEILANEKLELPEKVPQRDSPVPVGQLVENYSSQTDMVEKVSDSRRSNLPVRRLMSFKTAFASINKGDTRQGR